MKNIQNLSIIFLFLLIACGINFFEPQAIADTGIKYFRILIILISILISLPYIFSKNEGGFTIPVRIIAISTVTSIFMAYTSWDQSIIDSLKATLPLMLWFSFFYFTKQQVEIKVIERIILFYGILYIILFFFQFTHTDTVYFGWQEELKEERGIVRIIFPGGGVLYLSSFLALSKFTDASQKGKIWWGGFALMGLLTVILQVTRQTIAIYLIIYLFSFIKNLTPKKKLIIISIFSVSVLYLLTIDNPIVQGLSEAQKRTNTEGDKNIRVQAGTYFLTEFSPDAFSQIFGNGVPYWRPNEASKYGEFERFLQDNYGFYLSDVGIVAFYAMFGIAAIIAYLIIFFKSFTIPLPPKYYYLKYYLWYLLGTCLTSDAIYAHKTLITNVIVLICYQMLYKNKEEDSVDDIFLSTPTSR